MKPEEWKNKMHCIWLRDDAIYWMKLQLKDGSEKTVQVRTPELYYIDDKPYIQIETSESLGSGVPLCDVEEIMEFREN